MAETWTWSASTSPSTKAQPLPGVGVANVSVVVEVASPPAVPMFRYLTALRAAYTAPGAVAPLRNVLAPPGTVSRTGAGGKRRVGNPVPAADPVPV